MSRWTWVCCAAALGAACESGGSTPNASGAAPDGGAVVQGHDGDAGPSHDGIRAGGGHDVSRLPNDCDLDTGFPGDDYCIKPPPAEAGFQLHLGPERWDDPVEIEKWQLDPGQENTECQWLRTPNDQLATYYERFITMRPVSHHYYINVMQGDHEPASGLGKGPCGDFTAGLLGSIAGGETPIVQFPTGGSYPPENVGLGRALLSNALIKMEIHAINTTDAPLVREVWANVYWKDKAEITEWVDNLALYGGINVQTPPGTNEIMRVRSRVGGQGRVHNLYGHMHAHGVRFTAWRLRGDERTLLLEDFDWFDPLLLQFDSVTVNEPSQPDKLAPGGYTGLLELTDGDVLEWECEVHNDSDATLRYRNEVLTGEMCNMFGEYTGELSGVTQLFIPGQVTKL
jgi:hypothetical protein